jgi:uncharacterized protein DUF4326
MKVGFTGTRDAVEAEARPLVWTAMLHLRLMGFGASAIGHGCNGMIDDTADALGKWAQKNHGLDLRRFPPDFAAAEAAGKPRNVAYILRNEEIVRWCDALCGIWSGEEEKSSGTWGTILKARKAGKPVVVMLCNEKRYGLATRVSLKTCGDHWDTYCARIMPDMMKRVGWTDGYFGNEHKVSEHGMPRAGILYAEQFRRRVSPGIDHDPLFVQRLICLRGQRLACWCPAGAACHVDLPVAWLNKDKDPAGYQSLLAARLTPQGWASARTEPVQPGLF